MKEAQKNMLAQMGDLTIINVYSAGKGSRSAKLNNQAIRRLKEMKSVEAVTPKLTAENIPITLYVGRNRRYKSAYTTIVGIDVKMCIRDRICPVRSKMYVPILCSFPENGLHSGIRPPSGMEFLFVLGFFPMGRGFWSRALSVLRKPALQFIRLIKDSLLLIVQR